MPPIDFKLSKPFESTRRASFPERPSWPALAGRIGYLYEIPEERVGVSYLDSDGDEITLSSDSELQEYYQNNNSTNGGTIRFTVHDLGPNARRPAPEAAQLRTPLFGGDRGTFGVPANFDVFGTADGDWQTIAGMDEAGPHAFVESVPSEGTASKRASVFSSSTGTDLGRIITPTLWKGKARAIDSDSDQDTSRSVLGTDGPAKPPVHVMATNPFQFIPSPPAVQTAQSEVSATILNTALSRPASTVGAGAPRDTVPNSPQAVTALEAPGSPILAPQSMPTPPAQPKPESPAAAPEARPEATPEPQAAPQNPNTFYTDFATFLTTAATVFSQHPELGEGLRNIIANATNGSYLGANAEQGMQSAQAQLVQGLQQAQVHINQGMERAQEQVVQATAQARGVEGFVQRRVEEAVGGIFNALGATAAAPATPRQQPVQPSTPAGSPPRNEDTRSTRVPMTWSVSRDRNSFQPQSTFGHALNNWMDTVAPPSIQPLQAPQPPVAPQPPLPPQPPRVPQAPRVPPPPVPRSPSWGRGPRAMPPASPITRVASLSRRPGAPASQPAGPRRQSTVGMPAPEVTPVAAPALAPIPAPEPKSAREMLEESKQLYKAAKAAYRAERETRRGRGANLSGDAGAHSSSETEREFSHSPAAAPAPAPATVQDPAVSLTSLARSRYPPVELVSAGVANLPRRANTIAAPPSARAPVVRAPSPAAVETGTIVHPETYARVERRLADMGFAESIYPSLPGMINLHLRGDAPPTGEEEEEIVTRLLEELLSFSPPQPVASSSRRRLYEE